MNDISGLKKKEWDESYNKGDNYVWYPHEEVIRFISKYFSKRTDINKFSGTTRLKGLDFGCGIGRHVFYMHEMQIDGYGCDISSSAIDKAIAWAVFQGKEHLRLNFALLDGKLPLPYQDNFFDLGVSHGVFDSMSFSTARENLKDISRITVPGGLFYMDIVSGDDDKHYREYAGEEIIIAAHEKGTIQYFYNFGKIIELIEETGFAILDAIHIKKENLLMQGIVSRYHLVLRNQKQ